MSTVAPRSGQHRSWVAHPSAHHPRRDQGLRGRLRPKTWRASSLMFTVSTLIVGALAGLIWHAAVRLPEFVTGEDGSLAISERSRARFFDLDASYVTLGLVLGIMLGSLAWHLFQRLGWWVVVIASAGGLAAGLLCWWVGVLGGPTDFDYRVAQAMPGERVPIDFTIYSPSAPVVWILAAAVPVLLYSSLSRVHEPPTTPELDPDAASADELEAAPSERAETMSAAQAG